MRRHESKAPKKLYGGSDDSLLSWARIASSIHRLPREDSWNAERIVHVSTRALFVLVALLLLADLHSSYVATDRQWETNPFLSALAEHIGTHAALVCAKFADLGLLSGLYALWRRSKAHSAVTLVLLIAAFEYAQVVMNNYQG